jgi:prevent-host-death family protein
MIASSQSSPSGDSASTPSAPASGSPDGEAKNNFGLLIDNAQRAPVRIEKHGLPAAFVLSVIDFEQLVSGQIATGKGRGRAA